MGLIMKFNIKERVLQLKSAPSNPLERFDPRSERSFNFTVKRDPSEGRSLSELKLD